MKLTHRHCHAFPGGAKEVEASLHVNEGQKSDDDDGHTFVEVNVAGGPEDKKGSHGLYHHHHQAKEKHWPEYLGKERIIEL